MEIIASGRQSGKTTKLMHECHEANMNGGVAYMVVHSHAEAYRIAKLAEKEGLLGFRFPLTFDEFLSSRGRGSFTTAYYIDNTDILLSYLGAGVPVVAAAINIP